jgi:hypothetical protein
MIDSRTMMAKWRDWRISDETLKESTNENTVVFSKDEMEQLHRDGKLVKADNHGKDHTYIYSEMMERWSDWRLDPDSTLNEVGSLPTTVNAVNSPNLKKAKPPTNAKRGKQFIKHHKFHSGPHITGEPAELSTYDFDDDDYENEGGLQKRKDTQKRGYEPVEVIEVNGIKYERVG